MLLVWVCHHVLFFLNIFLHPLQKGPVKLCVYSQTGQRLKSSVFSAHKQTHTPPLCGGGWDTGEWHRMREWVTRYSLPNWPSGIQPAGRRRCRRWGEREGASENTTAHKTCYEIVMRIYVLWFETACQTTADVVKMACTLGSPCHPGEEMSPVVGSSVQERRSDPTRELVECTTKPKKHIARSGTTRKI